jgi:hypothetical protein
MTRKHIRITVDKNAVRGAPVFDRDGATLSSIVITCHPDDEALVMARVKGVLASMGATNIKKELPT